MPRPLLSTRPCRPLRVLTVTGTRPDVIKLAPVIRELESRAAFDQRVVLTAQHRDLVAEPLALFGIACRHDLDLMTEDQSLSVLAGRLLEKMDALLCEERPDWLLVQGDTTSAMAAGLAAFHRKVRVGHVEAGLRTHCRDLPFPEEMNRRLLARLSRLHFAPTPAARTDLLREGVAESHIYVTGNTIVDALNSLLASGRARCPLEVPEGRRLVVLTCHRREVFGAVMERVFAAVARLAVLHDLFVVFPVHPNPSVRESARRVFGRTDRVRLIAPLAYPEFIGLVHRADLVLSDSGGVQEEAPGLGVPVVVLRDVTERREGVEAGWALLAGTDPDRIVAAAGRLLEERSVVRPGPANPYGDGQAARRIADILEGVARAEG